MAGTPKGKPYADYTAGGAISFQLSAVSKSFYKQNGMMECKSG
jgi:hypothetical protein